MAVEIIRSEDGGPMAPSVPNSRPDPDLALIVAAMNAQPNFSMGDMPIPATRRLMDLAAEAMGPEPDVLNIQRYNARDNGPDLPVEVIWPKGYAARKLPILVWYHGGAWIYGSLTTARGIASQLANNMGAIVVSVDYRMAPEHRIEDSVADAIQAAHWAARHSAYLGGDSSKLAVGGDSAGGHLATLVAAHRRLNASAPVALQLLVYPATDLISHDYPSAMQYRDRGILNSRAIEHIVELIGADEATRHTLSPIYGDISLQPEKTIMVTAGIDPIRDQAFAYAEALRLGGKSVDVLHYPGAYHGWWNNPQSISANDSILRAGQLGYAELHNDLEQYQRAIDPRPYPGVALTTLMRPFSLEQAGRNLEFVVKLATDREIHSGLAQAGKSMVRRSFRLGGGRSGGGLGR